MPARVLSSERAHYRPTPAISRQPGGEMLADPQWQILFDPGHLEFTATSREHRMFASQGPQFTSTDAAERPTLPHAPYVSDRQGTLNYPSYVQRNSHPPMPPWLYPPGAYGGYQTVRAPASAVPPPPPMVHKVWILDCKSCGMFLTNRGMKAVLLLRPNVPLYSTDALPINCSAYSPYPETSSICASSPPEFSSATRTCECLTQTLCCHGCGSAVGYTIVSPCRRCTSSISASQRATNGHRFVFYAKEVDAEERRYVPGEHGVLSEQPRPPLMPPLHAMRTMNRLPLRPSLTRTSIPAPPPLSRAQAVHPTLSASTTADSMSVLTSSHDLLPSRTSLSLEDPSTGTELSNETRLPVSPVIASRSGASHRSTAPVEGFSSFSMAQLPPTPPNSRSITAGANSPSVADLDSSQSHRMVVPPLPPPPAPEKLKAGDLLYWHHLVRSGDIPSVSEDPRARKGYGATREKDAQPGTGVSVRRRVLAGR